MDFTKFAAWWARPLNAQASATDWILFTGFILITIWLWTHILRDGNRAVRAAEAE
ncbi:MAG: hypothetical protein KGJ13_06275 [Patescibacteria group bacterium]|nr:hypothetical protein [Patescibacteria group bacterium]